MVLEVIYVVRHGVSISAFPSPEKIEVTDPHVMGVGA